jgi:hypothetical protein
MVTNANEKRADIHLSSGNFKFKNYILLSLIVKIKQNKIKNIYIYICQYQCGRNCTQEEFLFIADGVDTLENSMVISYNTRHNPAIQTSHPYSFTKMSMKCMSAQKLTYKR